MTLEAWLAFALAAGIVLAIPGPTIMLVVGYALGAGKRTAWSTVPGVALGDFVAMTASLAGLGAVLSASAAIFTVLKWIGAAYLIYLGVKLWRSNPDPGVVADAGLPEDGRAMFLHSFAVTALNPKSIVFFIAFLPQFIDHAAALLPQFVVMELTFLVLATANAAAYAVLAGSAREAMRRPGVTRTANRIGGGILIGAGTLVAATSRSG